MTIFTPPDPATPAPTPPSTLVQGDAYFPAVDPADFTLSMRVVSQVTPPRLRLALLEAMMEVDGDEDLIALKALWKSEGHADLTAVPAETFAGESKLVFLYRRAVYSFAKADLDEVYRDNGSTAAGDRRADAVEATAPDHRRNARNALADLVGRPRATVELI